MRMKVTINIDCTPEEARAFFGLPDLGPVHAAYVDRMTSFVADGLTPADIEKMMRSWLPGMSEGFEQWRQAFFTLGKTGG
jgi:flagellar motor component MotA